MSNSVKNFEHSFVRKHDFSANVPTEHRHMAINLWQLIHTLIGKISATE